LKFPAGICPRISLRLCIGTPIRETCGKDEGFFFAPGIGEWQSFLERKGNHMNTLVIVLIAAVALVAAYALYGRWLAKK
jgi:hypothetical protein